MLSPPGDVEPVVMSTSTLASSICCIRSSRVSGARTGGLARAPSEPMSAGMVHPSASRTRPSRGGPLVSNVEPRTSVPTTGGAITSSVSRPAAAARARVPAVTGVCACTNSVPAARMVPWRAIASPKSGRAVGSGRSVSGSRAVTFSSSSS